MKAISILGSTGSIGCNTLKSKIFVKIGKRMKLSSCVIGTLCFLALATVCRAQKTKPADKSPDFSGTWVLNSGNYQTDMPNVVVMTILQTGNKLAIKETRTSHGQEFVTTKDVVADGQKRPVEGVLDKDNFVIYKFSKATILREVHFLETE